MSQVINQQFAEEKRVKQEGQKIVWPTRKETLITTAMVFVMVIIFSLFFLLVLN